MNEHATWAVTASSFTFHSFDGEAALCRKSIKPKDERRRTEERVDATVADSPHLFRKCTTCEKKEAEFRARVELSMAPATEADDLGYVHVVDERNEKLAATEQPEAADHSKGNCDCQPVRLNNGGRSEDDYAHEATCPAAYETEQPEDVATKYRTILDEHAATFVRTGTRASDMSALKRLFPKGSRVWGLDSKGRARYGKVTGNTYELWANDVRVGVQWYWDPAQDAPVLYQNISVQDMFKI